MKSGIYIIHCLENGKSYIGQAKDLEKRKQTHLSHLRTGNHACMELQQDFNKYGEYSFKFDVLEECEEEKLNHLEDYYILKYDAINNGYNSKRGNVLSLDSSNFGNIKNEDARFKEFCDGLTIAANDKLPFSLQVYIKLLNEIGNFNKTWEDYIDYIISDNTDIYIYKNTLNGIMKEKVSKDNISKIYNKYMIYIKKYKLNAEFNVFINSIIIDGITALAHVTDDLHDFSKNKTFKQLIEEYDIYNKTLPLMQDIIADKCVIDRTMFREHEDIALYGDDNCTMLSITACYAKSLNLKKIIKNRISAHIDDILLAIYFENAENDEDEYTLVEKKYNEYLGTSGLKMYMETIV